MSAASKSTALAACTSMLVAMVVLAGVAGAGKRDRTPPSPPVDVHVVEATESAVYVEWTPAVDDVAVAGYYVYRDVGRASVSRPSYTVTSMRCGESGHIWVQAFDSSGNRSERAEAIVSTAPCPDTIPPTTPSGFRQDVTTEEAVVLSWTPSSDASGVVGYGVYEGATKFASTSEPTVTLDGLRCDTSYQYGFDAVDGAGNRSRIALVYVQTASCPDDEAPSAPTGVEVTARTSTSISLSWLPASDNLAVAGYEVLVDGDVVSEVDATSATISDLACATSYTLGVTALDAAGNRSETVTVTSSTDACPAAPSPPNDTMAPSAPTDLSVTRSTAASIAIAWSPSTDNVAVAGYGVYVDGRSVAQTTETSFTVSGLACGTAYSLAVDAYDESGNRSTRATVTASTAACADTQAPTAPANVAASSRTPTSITLSWSASSDNVGVAGYGLYRAGSLVATASGTSGVFANLACNTSYTLSVDAYDAAGNRSSKTNVLVSTTACQDTSPPSAPSGLTATSISETALTLTWNASSDNVGVTAYDVYRSGTMIATVTSTSSAQTGLACGTSYWFGVVARDAAGNSSPRATLQTSTQACPAPPPAPPPSGFPSTFTNGPLGSANILPSKTTGALLGIWPQSAHPAALSSAITSRETAIGRKLDFVHVHWAAPNAACDYGQGSSPFTSSSERWVIDHGSILVMSWTHGWTMDEVNQGRADACLIEFGRRAAAFGNRFLLRIYWEFSGTWMRWSSKGQPFIDGWRRTVTKIREGGGTNVGFIWSPDGGYRENAFISYPGDEWVDWAGVSAYNMNKSGAWCSANNPGPWCELNEVLGLNDPNWVTVYDKYSSQKPFMVTEGASVEDPNMPGRKGQWLNNVAVDLPAKKPKLRGLSYFDVDVSASEDPTFNWRLDTSQAALDGFSTLARQPFFNAR